MRFYWQILSVSSLLLVLSAAMAQASFSLTVSGKKIYKDEVIQATYTVLNGDNIYNFEPPAFTGWKVVEGPAISNAKSVINGVMETRASYIYTLAPTQTGTLTVPAASITVQGRRMQSYPEKITVLNEKNPLAGKQPTQPQLQSLFGGDMGLGEGSSQLPTLGKNESPAQKIKDNMFVRITTSKQSCYVGEPVLVTYKLYSAIDSKSYTTKQPTFSGCSVIEMTPDELVTDREEIHGKLYKVFLLRKVQLVPLQAGNMALDFAEVETEATFNMAGNQQHAYSLTLRNSPVSIHVNPLPEKGKPSTFTGSIGRFTIDVHAREAKIPAGENDTILITISGEGNIQDLLMPPVQWPGEIEHFEASNDDDINKAAFPVAGRKTFLVPIIAHKEGKIEIPPVAFSFFNAQKGVYETIHSKSIQLEVTKALSSVLKRDSTIITKDFTTRKYIWIVPAIALAVITIVLIGNKRDKKKQQKSSEPIPVPANTSLPVAEEEPLLLTKFDFHAALDILSNIEDDKLFYTKAKEVLTQAMQEHLVLPNVSDTTILLNKLNNTNPALAKVSNRLLTECNLGIYSPVTQDRENMMEELKNAIAQLIA